MIIPPKPPSRTPPPPKRLAAPKRLAERRAVTAQPTTKLGKLFALMDTLTAEQKEEVYAWLAAHPDDNADFVRRALFATYALDEGELISFLTQLKSSVSPEIWEAV